MFLVQHTIWLVEQHDRANVALSHAMLATDPHRVKQLTAKAISTLPNFVQRSDDDGMPVQFAAGTSLQQEAHEFMAG